MPIKLFLLGRPGCGKSSATHFISKYIRNKQQSIKRFKDFDILKRMSNTERYKWAFTPTLYDGFDVIDESVFDEALKKLEKKLHKYLSTRINTDEIITIEFARRNNVEAFKYFSNTVSNDAYALFIDTNLEECIRRVKQRMIKPKSSDDHYVSEKAIREIYAEQILPDASMFPGKFKLLDNNGSVEDFEINIDNFVQNILKFK